jgi:hypothetical protein
MSSTTSDDEPLEIPKFYAWRQQGGKQVVNSTQFLVKQPFCFRFISGMWIKSVYRAII